MDKVSSHLQWKQCCWSGVPPSAKFPYFILIGQFALIDEREISVFYFINYLLYYDEGYQF